MARWKQVEDIGLVVAYDANHSQELFDGICLFEDDNAAT